MTSRSTGLAVSAGRRAFASVRSLLGAGFLALLNGILCVIAVVLSELLKARVEAASIFPVALFVQIIVSLGAAWALVRESLPQTALEHVHTHVRRWGVQLSLLGAFSGINACLTLALLDLIQVRVECSPSNLSFTVGGEDRTEGCNKKVWLTRGQQIVARAPFFEPKEDVYVPTAASGTALLQLRLTPKPPLTCQAQRLPGSPPQFRLTLDVIDAAVADPAEDSVSVKLHDASCEAKLDPDEGADVESCERTPHCYERQLSAFRRRPLLLRLEYPKHCGRPAVLEVANRYGKYEIRCPIDGG